MTVEQDNKVRKIHRWLP